jgi:hypothetical protein
MLSFSISVIPRFYFALSFSNRSRVSLLQIGVCHLVVRRNVCRVEFTAQVLFGELLKDIAAMARAEE